jgi:hypothetical protein
MTTANQLAQALQELSDLELCYIFQSQPGPIEKPEGDGWVLMEQNAGTRFHAALGANIGGMWLLWSRPAEPCESANHDA